MTQNFGTLVKATFVQIILNTNFFSTFYRRTIFFEPKVSASQNYIGHKKMLGLKIILGTKIFFNKIFFTKKFPFGNFFLISKFYFAHISFMQHFSGLNIFQLNFFSDHTRLHLDKPKIWQVLACKMEPPSGNIS